MEPRELKQIVEALKKKPALKTELASVRFAGEVFGTKSLDVPLGAALESLGAWSDNGALLVAEQAIASRGCGALNAGELKAASAILKEYGDAVPQTLRAFTLGQQGKKAEAADQFASFIDQQLPGACQSEHPMYSYRRASRVSFALQCLKAFAPTRDVSAQEKTLQRAQDCAKNNQAVG